MTISNSIPKVAYSGNGTTKVFAVPFEFFVNTDLYIKYYADYVNNPSSSRNLVYGTDYTVTGGNGTTGSVTLVVAPVTNSRIEIIDNVPLGQTVAYQAFGPFPAEAHERALDRLSVQIKQVANSVSDAVGGAVSVISVFGRNGSVVAQQSDYALYYSLSTHVHSWSEIQNKPTLFPPVAHTHDWVDVQNKPVVFPPSAHTHVWGEITDALEQGQDMVGAMFVHAGHTGATFTYDDTTGLIYANVTGGGGGNATGSRTYNYDNSTSMVSDPGAGNFRMNAATYLLTTQLSLSNIDLDGTAPDLGSLAVNDIIILSDLSIAGYGRYVITALNHTPTGYSVITVTCDTNNTAAGGPNNNNDFQIQLNRLAAGLADAPNDGVAYARKSQAWAALAWTDVTGKPTTFAPSAHNHVISEVTGLQPALDAKSNTGHTHTTANITGLDAALANKSDVGHVHTIANVTGLQAALDGKETLGLIAGINTQAGATYTFVIGDIGKTVEGNSAVPQVFTVPPSVFAANSRIDLSQLGVGSVTLAPGAGVTIHSSGNKLKLTGQYSGATLLCRATNEFYLFGDLA